MRRVGDRECNESGKKRENKMTERKRRQTVIKEEKKVDKRQNKKTETRTR